MRSVDIRDTFLRFFLDRDHRLVPSSSLIPGDPTMLLTTAGMVQFKPYFMGEADPPAPRLTSAQKCVRTVDIDDIGRTDRHLTYFEMLGNFSFDGYPKEQAVAWAYELLTERFGLDPQRMWPTVFREDDETVELWQQHGFPTQRIQRLGMVDNFWDTGGPGPCGPCSEIFYDRGPRFGGDGGPAVNPERYLEVWNLVFMRYIRGEGDDPESIPIVGDLPQPCIESGLGLERLAVVLQGVDNVHEIDLLEPVLERVAELAGQPYPRDKSRTRLSMRLVVDHVRASAMLLGDGVLPSNEGRGYVLRRLVRRAIHHGRLLGIVGPFVTDLASAIIDSHRVCRPELETQRALVESALAHEAEAFDRTLRQGSRLLDIEITRTRERAEPSLPARTAFRLHDTYGFPLDLTMEIARDAGLDIDADRVDALMTEQRQRAQQARTRATDDAGGAVYSDLLKRYGPTGFDGYDSFTTDGTVLALLDNGVEIPAAGTGQRVDLIMDRTSMYAEAGGQIGDTGAVRTAAGAIVRVTDTTYGVDGLRVHVGEVESGEIRAGDAAQSIVDGARRAATARSHSATHVLHAMLRTRLGDHARQHGSLVAPGRLRFDFSHFGPLDRDELTALEEVVNARVLGDPEVRVWETSRDEAMAVGAMALFGEKYGEVVRVVDIGDFSRELCGGTHVEHGSQVGPVRIVGETSIGSGLRRIDALTGVDAIRHADHDRRLLEEVGQLVGAPPDQLLDRLRQRLDALVTAERALAEIHRRDLRRQGSQLAEHRQRIGTGWLVVERLPAESGADELRTLVDAVLDHCPPDTPGGVLLGAIRDGKAQLVLGISRPWLDRGVRPRDLLEEAARIVGGGAGGTGAMAFAGGRNGERLDAALHAGHQRLSELLADVRR